MGAKYTESQAKATKKYLKGIGEFKVRVDKKKKEVYQKAADAAGVSLNTFIVSIVDEKLGIEKPD